MPSTVLDSDIFKDMFGTRRDARRVLRRQSAEVLRRCGGGACGRAGAPRRHSARRGRRHREARAVGHDRSRCAKARSRECRLSDPRAGAAAFAKARRGRAATCTGARPRRTSWTPPRCCKSAPRSPSSSATWRLLSAALAQLAEKYRDTADARPHASATGAADHLRLQVRDLALHDGPPCRAPARVEAARAGRAARRRRRHARLARRQGVSTCGANTRANSSSAIRRSPGMWRATPLPRRSTSSRLVTGSLGKIGFDIMLMMMTELGEAFEPFADHRGASSPCRRSAIRSPRKSSSPTPRRCASTPAWCSMP